MKQSITKTIKSFISNLWFKFITNPIQERIKLRAKLKEQKIEKDKFEKTHSVELERVKHLMFGEGKDTKQVFLDEKLIEGAKHVNTFKKYITAPSFYEPEICDIHNENPDRNTYPNIKDIKDGDRMVTEGILSEQSVIKNTRLRDKAKFLWRTRA
jgi:hypothetical protein